MDRMFFQDWFVLIRTVVIGVFAYVSLLALIRFSGKRTLAQMNAFDFVVTVALGSTLATILLSREVALAQGALAFAVLIGLQYVITWTSVRVGWVRRFVTGEPVLLMYQGNILQKALFQARVTDEELRAAVRATGIAAMQDVEAVVLETNGSFSVVRRGEASGQSSLQGVNRIE